MNVRKLLELQIALQGTERDIDKIIKEITKISKHEEVVSFKIFQK